MGINCIEADGLNEEEPCELSNDSVAVVTIADELEHAEQMKV